MVLLQELNKDSPDSENLLSDFPNGAKSIIVEQTAMKWQVFTQVGYQGVSVTLVPGRRYTSLDAMGLGISVKSMKRFSGDNTDVSTEAVVQ